MDRNPDDPSPNPVPLGYGSPAGETSDDAAFRRAEEAWNRPLPGGPDRTLEPIWVVAAVAVLVLAVGGCILFVGLVSLTGWSAQLQPPSALCRLNRPTLIGLDGRRQLR